MKEVQQSQKNKDIKKEPRARYIMRHQIVDQFDPVNREVNIFDKVKTDKNLSIAADQIKKQYQILGKFENFQQNGSSPTLKTRVSTMMFKMKEEQNQILNRVMSRSKINSIEGNNTNRKGVILSSPKPQKTQKKKDNKNQLLFLNNNNYDFQRIEKRQIFDYINQIQSQIQLNKDLDHSQNFQTRDFERIQQQKRERIINNYTSYNNQWQQFQQKAQESINRSTTKMLISTSIRNHQRKLDRLKFTNELLSKQEQDLLKERDNYWISTLRNNDSKSTRIQTENNELFEFEGNTSRINVDKVNKLYHCHTQQNIFVNDSELQSFQLSGTNKLNQEISYLLDKKMGTNNYYKVKIKTQPTIEQEEVIAQDSQYIKKTISQSKFMSTIN